jgi:hypothetical protein
VTKKHLSRILICIIGMALITLLIMAVFIFRGNTPSTALAAPGDSISEPIVSQPVTPFVWNGDVRDLPQLESVPASTTDLPRPGSVNLPPEALSTWVDPLVQSTPGSGLMPDPIKDFEGLYITDGGNWHPPDTNGDVGPTYYVEVVNIGFGIFRKSDGVRVASFSYDSLFDGTGTTCDNQNRGDVVAVYDSMADRWILSDFSLPSGGPYLECIAVSQTGDPVSGGWYFYALNAGNPDGAWHDYPKMGVWPDAYYMTANMFSPDDGAKVWALDRQAMLVGGALTSVSFNLGPNYWSLLPGNMKGAQPPAGSPDYFVSSEFPSTLYLWKFHVDWAVPGNSTFTGPVSLAVANFGFIGSIPQPAPGSALDSLSDRLMFSLHYRNRGEYESLWVNQTVASGGVAGVRWYEIRDPGGTPVVYQQGTYQPDSSYRWMGSVATDQDGNMALGYSVSSSLLKPAIRYAGRLNGDPLGELPQGEVSLIEGNGVQTGSSRWGDYSLMTVDPVDDCTFWYTQEYVAVTSGNWNTRIGSFKFPSCGQPKGFLAGHVLDAVSGLPVSSALVSAESPTITLTTLTSADGFYTLTLPAAIYILTAGPLMPGYPQAEIVTGVVITAGEVTTQDFHLLPSPYLEGAATTVMDRVPNGNGNGFPEPGEQGLQLGEGLLNTGAYTSTNISAFLESLTSEVVVDVTGAVYPDITAGNTLTNTTPFVFSIDPSVACGTDLNFRETVTDSVNVYTVDFTINASQRLPRQNVFSNDVEGGTAGWTTGGANNSWGITTSQSHSPTHSWTDSPSGNYLNNTNSYLRSPLYNLSGMRAIRVSAWIKYDLEAGWDYVYLEYSTNGGNTWSEVDNYTGQQPTWTQVTYDVPALNNQASVRIRFRLVSDSGVVADGIYIDDIVMSYEPYTCEGPATPSAPALVAPADGTVSHDPFVTFVWRDSGQGGLPTGYVLNIDMNPSITVTYPTTSTALTLTAGVHSWDVAAYNDQGLSASETWTVTVMPDAPGVPTLLSPLNQSVTSSSVVTFAWEAGSGGPLDGYYFILDGEVITLTTSVPQLVLTLSPGSHIWSVAAYNFAGNSAYADPWVVYVPYPIYLPIVHK